MVWSEVEFIGNECEVWMWRGRLSFEFSNVRCGGERGGGGVRNVFHDKIEQKVSIVSVDRDQVICSLEIGSCKTRQVYHI